MCKGICIAWDTLFKDHMYMYACQWSDTGPPGPLVTSTCSICFKLERWKIMSEFSSLLLVIWKYVHVIISLFLTLQAECCLMVLSGRNGELRHQGADKKGFLKGKSLFKNYRMNYGHFVP